MKLGSADKYSGIKSWLNFSITLCPWMNSLTVPASFSSSVKWHNNHTSLIGLLRNQMYNVWKVRVWLLTLGLEVHSG